MSDEQLAVVIVSWNVRDLLARCLYSLYAELDRSRLPARVAVVDNASYDGSPDMIRAQFPQVELIAREDNLGFARGNNFGLRHLGFDAPPSSPDLAVTPPRLRSNVGQGGGVKGEALLLNPDTEVQPGAIKALLDVMHSRPDVAIVTSRLSYGSGAFQHSAFYFPGLGQLYIDLFPVPGRFYESRLNGRYPHKLYSAGRPFEIDTPLGAVMLLRRAAIQQVGFFDEEFALYCEEIDWAARFKEAGWNNLCAPAAQVVHHEGRSTSQARVASFVKLWTSRYRLHTKHPQFAPLWLARRIVIAGMQRKMRDASPEMKAACERIMRLWSGQRVADG
jgi:N-acetylglucosaminyl-diphospho-decaprenol L-rhamnosyltransferase